MRKKFILWTFGVVFIIFLLGGVTAFFTGHYRFAYTPSFDKVLNNEEIYKNGRPEEAYNVWGESISEKEADTLRASVEGKKKLSPEEGAVKVDNDFLELGREVFYEETFGNEVFLTDVMGILDGPISIWNISKAALALRGKGTNNLQVELSETVKVGDETFKKGEKIDTGLAVPKGSIVPLGMPVTLDRGKLKAGVTCAACHAQVETTTGKVVEGATNTNFNVGLLMAMASNSAAYFTHTEKKNLEAYITASSRSIENSDGKTESLPDPDQLEKDVEKTLMSWPPGFFDATIDQEANPTQVGDSFTFGDHPYSWSGMGMAGAFNGLTTLSNNVHAQGADSLAQSSISKGMFDIDKEVYIGTILQRAANKNFRYRPDSGEKPSEFLKKAAPHPDTPGVNDLVKLPTFPNVTLAAPDGLVVSSPGYRVNEQNSAVSAFQNTLVPPKPNRDTDAQTIAQGRKVFEDAGCIKCHAGRYKTNNKIIPAKEAGTNPSRAKALAGTQKVWDKASIYSPDTPVPVPTAAKKLNIPSDNFSQKDVELAFAHNDSDGGYKVKGLAGVYWQAPYLHDGGVAVGRDKNTDLGIPGTFHKGKRPDPYNSMQALVDESLRQQVVDANHSSSELRTLNIEGSGHAFWADEKRGFSKEEQNALIEYVLQIDGEEE
ncbi:electron transport protein [Alteribacillus sp. YIM 98480]|uniref:electron transport protein n=1 Tax=Alteribacillus sp. YIM 98480 TaxID=2606599 RepID=UPI00131C5CFB|nr:electron transport protein [Alteribacillus sp. YIM 98480]